MGRRTATALGLALAGVAALVHSRVLFLGKVYAVPSHLQDTVPAWSHLARSIGRGELPEWWEAVGLGVPFAAEPASAVFYPPAWLLAALPLPAGIDLLLALHVLVGALGVAVLARRLGADLLGALIAGGALAASGLACAAFVRGAPLLAFAWLPWVVVAADRVACETGRGRRAGAALALAAATGAALLAGDPATGAAAVLVALALVGLGAAWGRERVPGRVGTVRGEDGGRNEERWRALVWIGGALAAGVVLAAAALVPAAALESESVSIPPERFVELVWPGFPGARLAGADAGAAPVGLFLGLPVLALAAIGAAANRVALHAVLVAVACALLSLGDHTPLGRLLPTARFDVFAAAATALACAAAGAGATALLSRPLSRRRLLSLAVPGAVLAVAIAAAALHRAELAAALAGPRGDAADLGPIFRGGLGALLGYALFVAMAWAAGEPPRRSWATPLFAAVVVGQLCGQAWELLPVVERAEVRRTPALLSGVGVESGARLYRPRIPEPRGPLTAAEQARWDHDTLAPNSAARFGVAYLRGRHARLAPELERMWAAAAAASERLLDLAAVDYAVLPQSVAVPSGMPVVGEYPPARVVLVANEHRRPRAFVAHQWRFFAGPDELIGDLFPAAHGERRGAPLGTVSLLGEGAAPAAMPGAGPVPAPACAIASRRPERVTLRCRAETDAYAVLLDAWAPGWSARVDGEPAVIARADLVARAIPIRAGEREIELRYHTPGLRLGAAVSALAWLNLAACALLLRRRRRR